MYTQGEKELLIKFNPLGPAGIGRITTTVCGRAAYSCERVHKVGNFMFGGGAATMRMTSMVAGLAVIVAACGGEKKTQDQAATGGDSGGAPGAAAAAPAAATGKSHDVNMALDGSKYKF